MTVATSGSQGWSGLVEFHNCHPDNLADFSSKLCILCAALKCVPLERQFIPCYAWSVSGFDWPCKSGAVLQCDLLCSPSSCSSDHQMMSRPPSAVGYRRPLSHHAHIAMRTKPDMRYKVSCFSLCFGTSIRVEDSNDRLFKQNWTRWCESPGQVFYGFTTSSLKLLHFDVSLTPL